MSTIDTIAPDAIEDDNLPVETDEDEQTGTEVEADEAAPEADALDGLVAVQVDPNAVRIEANVRTQVALEAEFVRTVKHQGVIVPVIGYYDEDGSIVVRDGQRRILAAIQAGRATVPAYLVPRRDEKRNWRSSPLGSRPRSRSQRTRRRRPRSPSTRSRWSRRFVLAEVEDDPAVVKTLRQYVESGSGQFVHEAQRQRDKRAAKQQVEAVVAEYEARGLKRIAWPSYDDKETRPFSDLNRADGTALTEENYVGGNGYRFAVRDSWRGIEVGHFVTDWKKWGLKKRKADGTVNTPWTDEQKAERRELIANNKAWGSAEVVRREWLATFLSRKTAPKNALAFVADTLIRNGGYLTKALSERHPLAKELLGAGKREYGKPDSLATLIEQNPTRTTTVLLAIAIAAHEAATSKSTWRFPDRDDRAYFEALSGWGYPLSDVEGIVVGIAPEATGEAEPEDDGEDYAEPDEGGYADEADAPEDDEADAAEPDENADPEYDEDDPDLANAA